MLGDTNWLQATIGFTNQELNNLFQTLQGDKDLNSTRRLPTEAKKELTWVKKNLQEAHIDHIDPTMVCILVILPSTNSRTGILMQMEDYILE